MMEQLELVRHEPRDAWWPEWRGDRMPWLGRSWRVFCWRCGHLTLPHLYVDWRDSGPALLRNAERSL